MGASTAVELTLNGTSPVTGEVHVLTSSPVADPTGGGQPNAVSFPFEVVEQAFVDLYVDPAPLVDPLTVQDPFTSTTWVVNRGTVEASDVTVTQQLLVGFTINSAELTREDQQVAGQCTVTGQAVTCDTAGQPSAADRRRRVAAGRWWSRRRRQRRARSPSPIRCRHLILSRRPTYGRTPQPPRGSRTVRTLVLSQPGARAGGRRPSRSRECPVNRRSSASS